MEMDIKGTFYYSITNNDRRGTLSAKEPIFGTQAPAPDWLAPVLNQSGALKFCAGAWVQILAPLHRVSPVCVIINRSPLYVTSAVMMFNTKLLDF